MQALTQDTFSETIKGDKVIIFAHKTGCSNCSQMKPHIEQLGVDIPDTKVYDIEVVPEEETKMPPKWIMDLLPKGRFTFPVILCYSKSQKIFMTMGMFPVNTLPMVFVPKEVLQADYTNTVIMTEDIKVQHQNVLQAIADEQQVRIKVIRRRLQLEQNTPETDDWELGTPTINESDKKACDVCQ